ncbi:hypothetical protein ACWDA7_32950 [Streptomyces sp. NPDC001156]
MSEADCGEEDLVGADGDAAASLEAAAVGAEDRVRVHEQPRDIRAGEGPDAERGGAPRNGARGLGGVHREGRAGAGVLPEEPLESGALLIAGEGHAGELADGQDDPPFTGVHVCSSAGTRRAPHS